MLLMSISFGFVVEVERKFCLTSDLAATHLIEEFNFLYEKQLIPIVFSNYCILVDNI